MKLVPKTLAELAEKAPDIEAVKAELARVTRFVPAEEIAQSEAVQQRLRSASPQLRQRAGECLKRMIALLDEGQAEAFRRELLSLLRLLEGA